MTDIAITIQTTLKVRVNRPLPFWMSHPRRWLLDVDISGILSGTFEQPAGVPVEDIPVMLYYSPNGALIARKKTNAAGAFSFANLDKTVSDYHIVVFPAGNDNALIYSKLTPA